MAEVKEEKGNCNLFWTLSSGEHQNLLDEAIDKLNAIKAENERLRKEEIRFRDFFIQIRDKIDNFYKETK